MVELVLWVVAIVAVLAIYTMIVSAVGRQLRRRDEEFKRAVQEYLTSRKEWQ